MWFGLTLLVFSALAIAGMMVAVQAFGLVLPGVRVGQVGLGWRTQAQAANLLEQAWSGERAIQIGDGQRLWSSSAAFLGLDLDAPATAQAAFRVGRDLDGDSSLLGHLGLLLRGRTVQVQPVVTWDEAFTRFQLELWAQQINTPAQDAGLSHADGRWVAVPASYGSVMDVDQAVQRIAADPAAVLVGQYLRIDWISVRPRIEDVSAALAQAEAISAHPLTITAYDPVRDQTLSWTAPPETVSDWLTVTAGESGPQVSLADDGLRAYLNGLQGDLGPGRSFGDPPDAASLSAALLSGSPIQVTIRHSPSQYTVQSGDTLLKISWRVGIPYWRITQANPGMDPDHLPVGQAITIPSPDDLLPLPVTPGKRIQISISQQRMRIFEHGEQIHEFVISTGVDRSPTQPGVFQVQTHEPSAYASVWDLTMPDFLGIYEAWPGFMNGIHGLPTLANGTRLWASILGKPASYGCIILDLDDSAWLYQWAEDGVVVEIVA